MSKKKNLLPCEVVFSSRKYPEKFEDIKSAYNLRKTFDKLHSDIDKVKNKLDGKSGQKFDLLMEEVEKFLTELKDQTPKFVDYLLTSVKHTKIRKKRLDVALSSSKDENIIPDILDKVDKVSESLTELGMTINSAVKNIIKIQDCKSELVELRDSFSDVSDNPQKDFRYLYKNV